ncbi:hypothetical protein [Aliarcobacter vitoriensis]|uniref:DUF3244 domain-containing protein n=1 Tax=Aliarcobacter vitoriensis TaxID=2011099 RepID=A0A366MUG9_9BACT|nr:hypothetical protein [Aliarcobacter vitoriensis]RBQ29129.1 hypothetical protein CRU91_05975 [Aliarcobacter vitoriensis]
MKKYIFALLFVVSYAFASNEIQKAFLVALFTNNGKGENVQHKITTTLSYVNKGEIISKVAIIGNYNKNTKVIVKLAGIEGKLLDELTLYNDINKKVFGTELTFKHNNIPKKGYFEVFVDGKLYDTKVFVK